MGNEQSNSSGEVKKGYHVLQVQSGSPGELAGLLSFFDFIVGANDAFFDREESAFVDCLKQNIGKEVKLSVFNLKSNSIRYLRMVPSNNWGGNGLAGISIRFCTIENATELVWHVLEVYPNSPASNAGLQGRSDYIVGTPDAQFNSSDDFYNLIANHEGKPVPLYVYNTQHDRIRVIQIVPNRKWGGEGSMGCDVAFGYLHRIPLNIGAIPSSSSSSSFPSSSSQSFRPPSTSTPISNAPSGPVFTQQHYPAILQSVPVQLIPPTPSPISSSTLSSIEIDSPQTTPSTQLETSDHKNLSNETQSNEQDLSLPQVPSPTQSLEDVEL